MHRLVKYAVIISFLTTLSGCSLSSFNVSKFFSSEEKESVKKAERGDAKTERNLEKNSKNLSFAELLKSHSGFKSANKIKATGSMVTEYKELTEEAKECIQKYFVGYEYALCLYNNGDMKSAANYLKSLGDSNQLVVELYQKIETPLNYIVDNSNLKLNKWLNRKTDLGEFLLKPPMPIKPKPRTISIVKREFETMESFKQRAALAKKEVDAQDAIVENNYNQKMNSYNQALASYKTNLAQEKQEREQRSLNVYLDFVNNGIADVLGNPYFINPIYDADQKKMFVELQSKKSNFNVPVAIDVEIDQAKSFKQTIATVLPVLEFDATREKLSIVSIGAELDGKVYNAQVLDGNQRSKFLSNEVSTSITSKY